MTALALGLIAALCWGFHDICVRYLSQKTPLMAALLVVLVFGLIFHLGAMGVTGGFITIKGPAVAYAAGAGVCFLVASLGLYHAFQRGPVRLVAPIIGGYPVLSVGWATLQGTPISIPQILAVLAIVLGVGIVASLADTSDDDIPPIGRTIFFSVVSAIGFAGTFALGQHAAELSHDMPATLITRLVTTGLLIALMILNGWSFRVGLAALPILALMGIADGIALMSVLKAGSMANPEYAAVASSMFGLLTIVLARIFLSERMTGVQWIGCAIAFGGIGFLAL